MNALERMLARASMEASGKACEAVGRICAAYEIRPDLSHIPLMNAAAALHQTAANTCVAAHRGMPDGVLPPTDADVTALVKGWAQAIVDLYPDHAAIAERFTLLRDEVLP
jgi:hypothetical protein